jgi:H+/gluconate symporter-like permease
MPAAIVFGTSTFTMSALPGTPSIQNAIPMPFFHTTPFAAPGLGVVASVIMLSFGLWWLGRAAEAAKRSGEGFGDGAPVSPGQVAGLPWPTNSIWRKSSMETLPAHRRRSCSPPCRSWW